MPRTILHVDMDAFFASVEEREDPSLAGRPVIVGADPRGGEGRGVVAAASYAAREHGIHSAMPISRAYRLCPDGTYLRPRAELYGRVSDRIFEILRRYTDLVEPLSIDEAFLDVTPTRRLFGSGPEIARKIRREIHAAESLTASVGVATSRFIAKLASDLEKPDGLVVVPPGTEREFLEPLPIERLRGAGPKAVQKFRRLGVGTIGEAARVPLRRMTASFGEAAGRRFHELARGHDEEPVNPDRERKSLGKEKTFSRNIVDRERVERTLLQLTESVASSLRKKGFAGSTITLKLRWEGFETSTRQTTLDRSVDTTGSIWPVIRKLFRGADDGDRPIRLVGVTLSGLTEEANRQLSLFGDGPEGRPDDGVAAAVDEVSRRYGDRTLTRAALLEDS